eukprot:m.23649 g.23649  ORF g.23649 m.23649 type:complete len:1161 (+) comp7251_c0_seq1:349-3831(+)
MRACPHAVMAVAVALLAVAVQQVHAGAQGTDVEKSRRVAKMLPRFTGPSNLPSWSDVSNDPLGGESRDYAMNVAIIAGVGILMALFVIVWACGRLCFASCCGCCICSCCAKQGKDHKCWAATVGVFFVLSLAFCIYGYTANSKTNDALVGETGLSKFAPNLAQNVIDVVDAEQTELNFISSTVVGIVDTLRTEHIPKVETDVGNGTTDIKDLINQVFTKVQSTYKNYSGVYQLASCVACNALSTEVGDLRQQVEAQTDSIVTDFQNTVDDIKGNLIGIETDITSKVDELLNETADFRGQAVDLKADIEGETSKAEEFEEYRRIGFIVLFLFPVIALLCILIGGFSKGSGHDKWFAAAAYLCFFYAFFMFIIFTLHIIYAVLSADGCVYADNYETDGLVAWSQDCANNVPGTNNCDMIKNVKGCLFGEDLVELNNASEQLNFSNIEFPSIPNVTISFSFSELDLVTDFVGKLGPQDFGVPQCYIDALIDDFNGDDDPELVAPRPSPDEWLRRALWIQGHLGYTLRFPEATEIGTHNSFNRDHIRTHITLNTTIVNVAVEVDESPTNQQYTLTDQLTLGVRRLELDVKEIATTSSNARHCQINGTDEDKVRVCHAGASSAAAINSNCGPTIPADACEALCVCNYGAATACGVNPPKFAEILDEIKTWLTANPTEVISLFLETSVNDTLLNDMLVTHLGAATLFLPTPGTDYSVVANWPTRDAMLPAQVVTFASQSSTGSCSGTMVSMPNVLCHNQLRAGQRYAYDSVNFGSDAICDDSQDVFFGYITGTTVINRIVFDTDYSDDNTNGGANTITPTRMSDVTACGLSPDLDMVDVDHMAGALWSFKENFPASFAGTSAAFIPAGETRWENVEPAALTKTCACRDNSDHLTWSLTAASTFATCTCPGGSTFAVPRSNKEANNLLAAQAAAGPTTEVWLNLVFQPDPATFTAEGGASQTWPDVSVANPSQGAGHGSQVDEAGISALDHTSFPSPYSEIVKEAQDLIADKGTVLVRRDDIVADANSIVSEATDLLNVWQFVQDVMENITSDTQPIVDAAERAVDLLARCGGLEQNYFSLKNTVCNDLVEGVSGIALAAFVLGWSAVFLVIALGPLIEGWRTSKTKKVEEEEYYGDGYEGYDLAAPESKEKENGFYPDYPTQASGF